MTCGHFRRQRRAVTRLAMAAVAAAAVTSQAQAFSIELKDVAPDRIERQRAEVAGRLPLAGTPDLAKLDGRLAGLGAKPGAPVLLRIFKASSEMELWLEVDGRFVQFATYPICHWAGTLGPKLSEGDHQSPEGYYAVTSRLLHRLGRWPRALNLGFPNAYDRANGRHGSYILMHGGCSSVGCLAMTTPVMREIYGLVTAAIKGGQRHVPVHVYPFRLTEENLALHADSTWREFWQELKQGSDLFEQTRRAPQVSVCDKRYRFAPGEAPAAAPAKDGKPAPDVRWETAGAIQNSCHDPKLETAQRPERHAGHN